ncbi:MAG: metal-sensitive transcriptional regulator [Thermicanus sp.]|nr:metal-sensitive transcriptional regulator [Thermicanus sp.]
MGIDEQALPEDLEEYGEGCCGPGCRHGHVPPPIKEDLTKRINRIEGQIRGIKGMIDRNVYCDDILNQISAAQSALNAVARILLESHMKNCVMERLKNGEAEVVEEFTKTISKMMK